MLRVFSVVPLGLSNVRQPIFIPNHPIIFFKGKGKVFYHRSTGTGPVVAFYSDFGRV